MSDFTKWINEFITPGQPHEILPGRRVYLGVQATPVGLTADQAMEMAFRLVECSGFQDKNTESVIASWSDANDMRRLVSLIFYRTAVNLRQKEEIEVLCEQLNVATTRAQRFRDALMRLAARANDYSLSDIWACIADALEISVKELESRLETE